MTKSLMLCDLGKDDDEDDNVDCVKFRLLAIACSGLAWKENTRGVEIRQATSRFQAEEGSFFKNKAEPKRSKP